MKVDYTTGKYKIYCETCKYIIMSYNDEHYAKNALHNALQGGNRTVHKNHTVVILT